MTRPGPGKFEGNDSEEIAESLYRITLDSAQSEDIGEADGLGWFALIVFDDTAEALPCWTEPEAENVVAYIVKEDSQGFFGYTAYETEAEARADWRTIEADHEEWQQERGE